MHVSNGKIVEFLQTLRTTERICCTLKRRYRYNDRNDMPECDMPEIVKAINNKRKGDTFTIHIPVFKNLKYNDKLKQKVPRKIIKDEKNLQIGMCFIGKSDLGEYWAEVKEFTKDYVVLDANHHLIGKDAYFDIEILSVKQTGIEPTLQEKIGIFQPQ